VSAGLFTGQLMSLLSQAGASPESLRLLTGSHMVAGQTITVQVQGLAELEVALDALPDKVAKGVLTKAVDAGGELMRIRAVELAPVDEYGRFTRTKTHLKDGIKKQMITHYDGVRGALVECRIGLTKEVFYGRFLEFGWSHYPDGGKIPARPFMRPAFEESKTEVLELVKTMVALGVEAAARESIRQ
jgi:HK97 gp10 family phage protein